jgi:3-oxoacyl-[acyl-carrier protein] reductase
MQIHNLKNDQKVVIITGASSGIGRETALRLAKDGMRVVLVARREALLDQLAKDIAANGGQALMVPVDVLDHDALHDMVKSTIDHWGRVDVLINNAGVCYDQPVVALKPDLLRDEIATNLTAVIECSQAVLPVMVKQGSGHIINIASIAGLIGLPCTSVYCATKAGVIAFSESLLREVKRYHIHVTAVCPGYVATDFVPSLKRIAQREVGVKAPPGLMPVSYVAERLATVVRHPRRTVIIPSLWYWLVLGARGFPSIADHIVPWFTIKP